MALPGSRAAKKSREKRREVREDVANEARKEAAALGRSEDEIRRAGRLAGKEYERYHMEAAASRSYDAFYAEHGREATAVLSAAAAVGAAIHPVAGAALTAAAVAAAAQTKQAEKEADAKRGEKAELRAILSGPGIANAPLPEPEQGTPSGPEGGKIPEKSPRPGFSGTVDQTRAAARSLWARFLAWVQKLKVPPGQARIPPGQEKKS